jgi:hypothetical protein
MGRILLLLLALFAAGGAYYYASRTAPGPGCGCDSADSVVHETAVASSASIVFTESDRFRQDILACLAFLPAGAYPASLPWAPVASLGSRPGAVPLENLLHNQPLAFLEMSLERYEEEVQGYTCTMLKRERIRGKLHPPTGYEKVEAHFREEPFSVLMNWKENAQQAQKVLYVEGENNGKMLVRPTGFLLSALVVSRDVNGPDARDAGHYTPDQFGVYLAMQRSVNAMRAAQARGKLHVRYEGVVTLAEVGDRPCYKFVRTPYEPPEQQGVNHLTLYIDRDTWLQVGSTLKDEAGQLIGEYFFRDIELNPRFAPSQFQRGAI